MRCPVCAVEVGKAQIICDNCGILLMDERYRQQMEAQEGIPRNRPSALRRTPGEASPEESAHAAQAPPAETSTEAMLKAQLEAHLQGGAPAPHHEEELLDLPPTDMSDVPPPPPPMADPGEPVVEEIPPETPAPKKAKGGLPPILNNFMFLAVMTLFIPLIPLFFALKSDWDKRRKVIFTLVHLFYWGLSFLLVAMLVMAAIGAAVSAPSVM